MINDFDLILDGDFNTMNVAVDVSDIVLNWDLQMSNSNFDYTATGYDGHSATITGDGDYMNIDIIQESTLKADSIEIDFDGNGTSSSNSVICIKQSDSGTATSGAETKDEVFGNVNRAVGWRQIVREEDKIEPDAGSDIISKDDLRTGEGRMEVEFVDASKLRMTEHTRIVIDNVVFDKDPSKSELAMTFAQGTARFVSGALGRVDKENIRLKTPSATIGIRGTDFTVTVDEEPEAHLWFSC